MEARSDGRGNGYNQGIVFNQPAYHGGPRDFDKFDLSYAFSGEGAMAHGYGVYLAKNKYVSEGYRKRLSGDKVFYDGQEQKPDLYLSIQNPKYQDKLPENRKDAKKLRDEGYDGVITSDGKYLVFEKMQIKSDNNQGTFDRKNQNIYYQAERQNVVDWTDKFDKVPTFAEIEKHIKDIIASGEVFDTLSPEWKIDIKGGNRVVDKITNKGNFQQLKMSPKKRHNKYVSGIKELINNSVYSHSDKNNKPKEKPNIANYHYFDVNVKIGDKSYWVRLECEETKNAHQGRYAQRSRQSHQSNNTSKGDYAQRSKNSSRGKNSLEQTNNNVKTVHLYNIKEMKANKVYYQSGNKKSESDYDYITNQVTGEKIDIEMNEDIKVDKIEPQEISSELPFKVSQKPSDNKKNLIKSLGLGKGKFINAVNNNTGETAKINDKTIEKSLSNISVKSVYYNDFCNIILNVESLFKTSQKILSYKDTKLNTDTKIARYANIAHIDNKDYLLEFVLKDNGEVKLYSVDILNNKKQYRENASSKNSMHHDTAINSITNIQNIFKSKLVRKYNNDYKNLQSSDNNQTYSQKQNKLFIDNAESERINNKLQKVKGYYIPVENIIKLTKDADESTIIHELAHWWLEKLCKYAQESEEIQQDLEEIRKLVKNNGEPFTTEQHERFARAFEVYMRTGSAKTNRLKKLFEDFKNVLLSLYDSIKELGFNEDEIPAINRLIKRYSFRKSNITAKIQCS